MIAGASCSCVGFLQVLLIPPTNLHSPADVHVRSASESKWALGVDVSLYYFFLMGGIPGKRTLQDPGNFLRIYACA